MSRRDALAKQRELQKTLLHTNSSGSASLAALTVRRWRHAGVTQAAKHTEGVITASLKSNYVGNVSVDGRLCYRERKRR